MKPTVFSEPLAGGFACYSTASGKLEMIGFQKEQTKIDERIKLAKLVRDGAALLNIQVWTELDEDLESLVIQFGPQDGWGLFAYPAMGIDEDIDGTIRNYPAWNIVSWYRDRDHGSTEEEEITKTPAGLVTALRIILRWLYDNHRGDVVEGVVQQISPKE